MKRVHIFIHGDVVGVGFRAWTQREASKLGISGWVRNADHKTVEAVIEGSEEVIDEMIGKCHQGPEISWVKSVDVQEERPTGEFAGFEIRY